MSRVSELLEGIDSYLEIPQQSWNDQHAFSALQSANLLRIQKIHELRQAIGLALIDGVAKADAEAMMGRRLLREQFGLEFGIQAVDTEIHERIDRCVGISEFQLMAGDGFAAGQVTRTWNALSRAYIWDKKFPGLFVPVLNIRQTYLSPSEWEESGITIDLEVLKKIWEGSKSSLLHTTNFGEVSARMVERVLSRYVVSNKVNIG